MKHIERFTVRWHDTDAGRLVRPSQLLMYMQECGNLQCKADGTELDRLRDEEHQAFILVRIAMEFYKPLYNSDVIDVETWVGPGKGFTFPRAFRIMRGEEVIAEAMSIWVLVDTETRQMLPVSAFKHTYPIDEMPKVELPVRLKNHPCPEIGKRVIVYSDLDYNGHMNNTKYPDMLCDFLPTGVMQDCFPSRMVMVFHHEAAGGDVLSVCGAPEEEQKNHWHFQTTREDGTLCLQAEMELTQRAALQ